MAVDEGFHWHMNALPEEDQGVAKHYWHLTSSQRSELEEMCRWATAEARTGKELAHVATLIVGAGLIDSHGPALQERINERIKAVYASGDAKLALAHAKGIGEALGLLRVARPLEPGD